MEYFEARVDSQTDTENELEELRLAGENEVFSLPQVSQDLRLREIPRELLRAFIEKIPKIELHRHLEGAIAAEELWATSERHDISLPARNLEELRSKVQIVEGDSTLLDFLKKFEIIGDIFVSPEAVQDLTYSTIAAAAKDGVRYLELRLSPYYMAAAHELDVDQVMQAVVRAKEEAQSELDIEVGLIVIVERQCDLEQAWKVEQLAEDYMTEGVVALDLANDEYNYPPDPFAEVFQTAKEAGLAITVHAGEAAGPDNIRTAIEKLGADRIGHGVRAFLDEEVVELLWDRNIPLELCPTSNVQTGAVVDMESHPLRKYLDFGLFVTLNTDDPAVSGVSLSDEFETSVNEFDLTIGELRGLLLNAVKASFLSESKKSLLREDVEEDFSRLCIWLASALEVD